MRVSRGKVKRIIDTRREKQVEASGDRAMQMLGFRVIRFSQARATQQTPGIPDRRYVHRARKLAIWWEAKRDGGQRSEAQLDFADDCIALGEPYVWGTDDELAAYVALILPKYPIL